MRIRFSLLLFLACAGGAPAAAEMLPPAATVTVDLDGTNCSGRWDGEPATADEILERSVALLERAIEAMGGPQYATEENIPYVRLEAPADATWSCLEPTLLVLLRAGAFAIALRPIDGDAARPDELARFPLWLGAEPPPAAIVEVRAGSLRLNGRTVAPGQLLARYAGLDPETELGAELAVVPNANASFLEVYEAFRLLNGHALRPNLSRCVDVRPVTGRLDC